MDAKTKEILTSENKSFFGFKLTDLMGIALMLIPVIISLVKFESDERLIPFLSWPTFSGERGLMPDLTCGLCAVAFYIALVVRYDFFPANNLLQGIISTVRAILDCWAIAALISPVASANNEISILFFSVSCVSLLFIAVVLTWIGLWVIAAYSWVIFIIAAVASWEAVARAMGGFGALFMITFGVSMILQIQGHVNLRDFSLGFRGHSSRSKSQSIVVNATTAYIGKDVASGASNQTINNLDKEKIFSEKNE